MTSVASKSIVASLCLLVAAASAAAETPFWPRHAPYEPGLYLSWNAPFGTPGASSDVAAACDDTAHVDTLYLVFDPGQQLDWVTSVEATLTFNPSQGDTLGDFWFFKTGTPNGGSLLVELHHQHDLPCSRPWFRVNGDGKVSYDVREGHGRLDLSYTVPLEAARTIAQGVPYCLGRVTISHRRNQLEGCGKPICIEWTALRIGLGYVDKDVTITRGEQRFATWNSADGGVCAPYRGLRRAQPWRPKTRLSVDPK